MSDLLTVRIITPERIIFSREADSVQLPGTLGEMQVLPGHVAVFSTIKPGQITVRLKDKCSTFATSTGFLEVNDNRVTILVDSAEGDTEIDPERARKAIEEYEDKLKNLKSDDAEMRYAFETKLATARARVDVFEASSGTDREAQHGFSRAVLPSVSDGHKDSSSNEEK